MKFLGGFTRSLELVLVLPIGIQVILLLLFKKLLVCLRKGIQFYDQCLDILKVRAAVSARHEFFHLRPAFKNHKNSECVVPHDLMIAKNGVGIFVQRKNLCLPKQILFTDSLQHFFELAAAAHSIGRCHEVILSSFSTA